MKYLGKSFSVHPGQNQAYRDNYDAVFGRKTREKREKRLADRSARERISPSPRDPEETRELMAHLAEKKP